jgi:hypothetical protein
MSCCPGPTWPENSAYDEVLGARVLASFLASDRTYGARRVWRDLLTEGFYCGLHRIERLMRRQGLRARPRRRGLPQDKGERDAGTMASNCLTGSSRRMRPIRSGWPTSPSGQAQGQALHLDGPALALRRRRDRPVLLSCGGLAPA